jgi:hypothetical protein
MHRVTIALAAGLTLLVVGLCVTLAHSPVIVARTNGPDFKEESIAFTRYGATYCQANELLPQGTSAIRLSLSSFTGPRVSVLVSAGGHPIASGERGSGWTSRVVTVPVRPLPRAAPGVTVCASFRVNDEAVTVFGKPTPATIAAHSGGRALPGRMWIEYLRPGRRSWASLAGSTAHHMGLGRAVAGTWIVWLALALMAAVAAIASRLLLRELR